MKREHFLPALAIAGALVLGTTACGGSTPAAETKPAQSFPANSTMDPIVVEPGQNVSILGVLVGVVRKV